MSRAVIYARVSTAEQAEEGYSIDAQLETVRKRIEQDGKELVESYVDRGVSGKSIEKRTALQHLLKDAKAGRFDEVWVWKTNRLARNHLDLLKIVEHLERYDVHFKSCTEHFDTTTHHGRLMMSILASIGEFERETIVENVKMGMKQRARTGKWNGGQVLGYASVKDEMNENKTRLEIVEKEAQTVKEIYANGRGFKSIANEINKLGHKSKKGNLFSINAVKEILMNPIYIGKIRYNRRENWSTKRRRGINKDPIIVEGEHEPIISLDLWDKVQLLYKQKSHKPNRIYSGSYPLTGLLKCPVCNSSMVAGRVKKKQKDGSYITHRYYHCGAWRNKGTAACRSNGVRAGVVEKTIFNKIKNVLLNDQILEDIVNRINETRRTTIKPLIDQLEGLEQEINGFDIKRKKWFELYEEGIITKIDLSERLETISNDLQVKRTRRESIQSSIRMHDLEPIDVQLVKRLMTQFNDIINKVSHEKKKVILNTIIDRITLNENRQVESIILKFNEESEGYLFNDKEGASSNEDAPSFSFIITI